MPARTHSSWPIEAGIIHSASRTRISSTTGVALFNAQWAGGLCQIDYVIGLGQSN